jgi:hypothetical protein
LGAFPLVQLLPSTSTAPALAHTPTRSELGQGSAEGDLLKWKQHGRLLHMHVGGTASASPLEPPPLSFGATPCTPANSSRWPACCSWRCCPQCTARCEVDAASQEPCLPLTNSLQNPLSQLALPFSLNSLPLSTSPPCLLPPPREHPQTSSLLAGQNFGTSQSGSTPSLKRMPGEIAP